MDFTKVTEITKASNTSFFYSFLLLPKAKQNAIYSVYAFCRISDDIVDDEAEREIKLKNLKNWRESFLDALKNGTKDEILAPVVHSIKKFNISEKHFLDLLDGMEMDLNEVRFSTFEELYDYCYKAASTVGLMCAEIFGYKNEKMKKYAEFLGVALQLTNIIRDVKPDAQRSRIYLPKEDLEKFGVSENEILSLQTTSKFQELLRFEGNRAKEYFLKALKNLVISDKKSFFAAEIMREIYYRLLLQIENSNYSVLTFRPSLNKITQVKIALKVWFSCQFSFSK
ncbi:MAG: squalene synthase HpnD [Calditrichaeota bacterium]|nr:MAG: squalene synthase HpnD [Calditrichota bacterium]